MNNIYPGFICQYLLLLKTALSLSCFLQHPVALKSFYKSILSVCAFLAVEHPAADECIVLLIFDLHIRDSPEGM